MKLKKCPIDQRLFDSILEQGNLCELQKLLDQIKDKEDRKACVNFCFQISLLSYENFLLCHYLIDLGADVNYQDDSGQTLLITAMMEKNNAHIIVWLLEHGATFENDNFKYAYENNNSLLTEDIDFTQCDQGGNTLFHYAIMSGNVSYVQALLDKYHGSLLVTNKHGRTLLHQTAIMGSIALAKLILQRCPQLLNAQDIGGFSAIMLSADGGKDNYTRYLLLTCNADIKLKSKNNENILHFAVISNKTSTIRMLIEKSPDLINQQDTTHKCTPLMAIFHNLIDKSAANQCDSLNEYINTDIIPIITLSLKHSADLTLIDSIKENILHLAAYVGNVDIAKILLCHEPQLLTAKNKYNFTPILIAVCENHVRLVEFLLAEFHEIINANSDEATTLTSNVAMDGNIVMANLLLNYGFSFHEANTKGYTPLMVAAMHGRCDFVRFLLDSGIPLHSEIYLVNNKSRTPLHFAASRGHVEVAQLLLQYDPQLMDYMDDRGHIPIITAALCKKDNMLNYFLSMKLSTRTKLLIINSLEQLTIRNVETVRKLIKSVEDEIRFESCLKILILNDDVETIKKYPQCIELRHIDFTYEKQEYNPFLFAIAVGAINIVTYWLEKNSSLYQLVNKVGSSAILVAAATGRIRMLELLLKNGARLNERNQYGSTCLHEAAFNGELNMVIYLLKEKKMSISIQNRYGKNPLYSALLKNDFAVIFCLAIWEADANIKQAGINIQKTIECYSERLKLQSINEHEKRLLPIIVRNAQLTYNLIKQYARILQPLVINLLIYKSQNPFRILPRDVKKIIIQKILNDAIYNDSLLGKEITDDSNFISIFRFDDILEKVEKNFSSSKMLYKPPYARTNNNSAFFSASSRPPTLQTHTCQNDKYIPPHMRKK